MLETANSVFQQLTRELSFQEEQNIDTKRTLIVERVQREMEESVWKRRDAAQEAIDRIARKAQEDEQGELDVNDLRLLQAQQRIGSEALVAHFQVSALRNHHDLSPAASSSTTPRQRKRLGSSISRRGLPSQLLQQESNRLADSITERILSKLLVEELPEPVNHRR